MMVLDASAVLAPVQDEPGADLVERELGGALLCAVNLAEVVGKLVDADLDPRQLAPLLRAAGVVVEPLTERDAELAGALRGAAGGRALSLGDRCCLSLALRGSSGSVLTADRTWAALDLPLTVRLIR